MFSPFENVEQAASLRVSQFSCFPCVNSLADCCTSMAPMDGQPSRCGSSSICQICSPGEPASLDSELRHSNNNPSLVSSQCNLPLSALRKRARELTRYNRAASSTVIQSACVSHSSHHADMDFTLLATSRREVMILISVRLIPISRFAVSLVG